MFCTLYLKIICFTVNPFKIINYKTCSKKISIMGLMKLMENK